MQTQTQRTILMIVFAMSLLFLWDNWQRFNGKPSMLGGPPATQPNPAPAGATATGPGSVPAAGAPASGVPAAGVPAGTAATPAAAPGAAAPTGQVASGQTITLANDVLKLTVDTVGGQVRGAELLKHQLSEDKTKNVMLFDERAGAIYLAQAGLIGAPQGEGFPTHRTTLSVVSGPVVDGGVASLTLAGESGGVKLVRRYSLDPGSYVVRMRDEVTNTSSAALSPTLYLQLTRDEHTAPGDSKFYSTYTGPVVYTDAGKFQKVDFGSIDKGKPDHVKSATDGWVGIIQHYFVSSWVPPEKAPREYYANKVGTNPNLYAVGVKTSLGTIAPGSGTSAEVKLYVGPQDQRVLEKVAPGLDLAVDYGWLTIIAKPIYWLLEQLHKLVGNWGWAIVLLTIVIKTIFFPLQAASYKSMARMKAVAPRLQAMRERYGDDRVKMNQAMMELYKQEKINPLGGCLPIVVQIPVFIALYWVLLASVEMRNAPWIGWIQDLAAPDPFYVLPLIMAGTMFIQTKLNPTPPDPVQAKVMLFMPIVFSVMFFFFPAGLVLYWLVNNIYSIAQQWVITRKIVGPGN